LVSFQYLPDGTNKVPVPFYLIRTEEVTALDGAPPKRFVVLAFDSKEKARG
jgi:hypothetical protein